MPSFTKTTLSAVLSATLAGVLPIGLTSCSATPPKNLMDVQPGETFALQQPVTIPAGKARQYIQFGKVTGGGFNHYEPHCRIEIYELQTQPYSIHPQNFDIERVQLGEEEIARQDNPALNLAYYSGTGAINDVAPIHQALVSTYEPPETMDLVHFYLRSDSQPNVYRLTCAGSLSNGNPLDAPRSERPQRAKINRILGPVGRIVP